ncbi:putative LRR receptor-like serine/threonine-protein kinase, partial [Zostera marina]
SLKKNILNGSVASEIWKVNFSSDKSLILDFQNNDLNSITGDVIPPSNVSI